MPSTLLYRVIGWDPQDAGSAGWLTAHGTVTKDVSQARPFDGLTAAERHACALSLDRHLGLWWTIAPEHEDDLAALQAQRRQYRPRQIASGPPPGW